MKKIALALVLAFGVSACYHATIDTGLAPGPDKIENKWAHSFLYGLVPPQIVETMEECPNGVAMVETRLSFLNQIANGLTLGIYTPMEITVTCAASGRNREDLQLVRRVADAACARTVRPGTPWAGTGRRCSWPSSRGCCPCWRSSAPPCSALCSVPSPRGAPVARGPTSSPPTVSPWEASRPRAHLPSSRGGGRHVHAPPGHTDMQRSGSS